MSRDYKDAPIVSLGAAGYSFPSGHTQNAFAAFGTLARRTESGVRRGIYCAAIVIVAFSRMYLGVHTPLDVGVSFVLGLILVFALYPVFRRAEKRPEIMYGVLAVMLALALGYLLYTQMWPFPGDTDAENLASARKNGFTIFGAVSAMLLAFHLDQRYLRFPTDACLPAQIVKVVAGLGIMLVLRTGLKAPLLALLGTEGAANAVRYFIVVVFAAAVWPITFRWFRGWGKGRGEAGSGEKKTGGIRKRVCRLWVYCFLRLKKTRRYMSANIAQNSRTRSARVIQDMAALWATTPRRSSMGKPRRMAQRFWYIRLPEAGVLNSGSISRSRMIPVLAVPVSMP